jgi:hypothetical protein
MFATCHKCVQRIQEHRKRSRGQAEASVAKNVVTSLVTTLQNLSNQFRKDQNAYLNSKYFQHLILESSNSKSFKFRNQVKGRAFTTILRRYTAAELGI